MVDNTDQIKGRAKVAAGAATGNKKLENEGRVDRLAGEVKHQLGNATKTVEDALGSATDKAGDALKSTRKTLEGWIDKVRS